MEVRQTTLNAANSYVEQYHRRNGRVVGHKWSLAAYKDGHLCGVAIVGRPTGRRLDDGKTLEVTRLKCLRNAVVPQQFYPVFRAIYQLEGEGYAGHGGIPD